MPMFIPKAAEDFVEEGWGPKDPGQGPQEPPTSKSSTWLAVNLISTSSVVQDLKSAAMAV